MREKLVAQSKIGKVLAMNAHVVDCKSPDSQSAVLVDAINKAGVVIENRISSNGQRIVTLSGLIGKIEHIGVLYLEMHYGTYSQDADQHSHHFEALRQSLKDCLSVS